MNRQEMFAKTKTIAIVGLSDKPDRASFGVAKYLQKHFKIIPINPTISTWEGQKCYATLTDAASDLGQGIIDLTNIFRRSEDVMPIVEESIKLKIPFIWLQLGIINKEAEKLALSNNAEIVMDECIAVTHRLG